MTIAGALALPLAVDKALADSAAPPLGAPASLRGTATPFSVDVANGPNPQTGLPIYGFLVYPSVFVGGVYNSNVYQTGTGQVGGGGFEITPNVTAVNDQGVHKTTLTLNADATFYPAASRSSPTTGQSPTNVTGSVVADHNWKPTNDLTVDILAGFARQNGIFGTFGAAGPSFVTSAVLATSAGSQQYWNQTAGAASVEKTFDRWSLRGGVGVEAIGYNPPPAGATAASQSSVNTNAFLRASYGITPVIRGFVEVDGGFSNYRSHLYNSDTYRIVAGLNSDMIGLFRGEVYAGVQKQFSLNGAFAPAQTPAFGATLFYYPTRALTVAASLEQGFGSAAAVQGSKLASASVPATGGDTLQTRMEADYRLADYWTVSLRAGWARTSWLHSPLIETAWTVGGSLDYSFWRNFSMTLNYQYTVTGANRNWIYVYAQNLVSAGITYRY